MPVSIARRRRLRWRAATRFASGISDNRRAHSALRASSAPRAPLIKTLLAPSGSIGLQAIRRSSSAIVGTSLALELLEEPQVVLEEEPDLRDRVAAHRDAFESHAEREPRDLFGVVADRAEHVRVHHAG